MDTDPRANPLRERIEDGRVALGVLENLYSPSLVEMYGELDLDFVWLDLEHGGPNPADAGDLEALLRAADVTGVEPLVRLPSKDPALVRKALDAGVRSLFISRVETAAEVRRAVAASRFQYDGGPGERGLASPRARRWGLTEDYVETEDEAALVGATIETREAVENVEDILAVPDLGFVFAGPLDLSVAYGHPGELDHPEVQAAVETIREAALDADVPLAGLGLGMDDVNEKADSGYRLLNLGTTTAALQSAVSGWLDDYEGER